MKKIFTLLSVAAIALSASAETVILSNPGKVKQNVLSGTQLGTNVPAGFSLQCMNESKNLESGSSFTIDGTNYVSIKCSNGAQNTLTLPEGYVATNLTIYTTINKDAATDRPCYWKEVAGIQYTANENNGIIESFKDYKNPNIQSFDIPNLNVVTFTNTGEQPFIVLEVTYEEAAEAEPVYPDKLEFTLNGETELKGVSVNQRITPYEDTQYVTIEITGESSADEITMDFVTPEGWDYALVDSMIGGSSSPWNTRSGESDHWYPVDEVVAMGYTKSNTFNFPVNGKDSYGTIYLVKGDKVWDTSIDIEFCVEKAEGSGDDPVADTPSYPDHLDYTINGEKELAGVTVDQTMDQGSLSINVLGKTDADEVSMTFATPEGWDGLLIMSLADVSGIELLNTRSEEDWYPIEYASMYGFVKGNTVTFPVDGEDNWATIALYKGDLVYQTTINVNFEVTKGGSDDPVFPEYFVVDTFNDALKVTQGYNKWGNYDITVEGEIFADSFPIVIDVPEGWDGFVCYNWSHEGDVTITENNPMPRATRAEEMEWISVEKLLANGYEKGNRFTFEPTFIPGYNNSQDIELHLYKGDKAMAEDILTLSVKVSKAKGPVVPESFEVSVNPAGLNVTQGEDYGVYTINVEGECPDDEVEVTLEVPEGWDGFLGMTDSDFDEDDAEPLKKVQASEWEPMDNILAYGFKETNTLKFKVDGEEHSGALYLYKSGLVDGANYIAVYTSVTKSQGVGVDTVESAGVARFFNLQGAEVANPEPGIYVKKENGKTTKVIVK
ncbi:MAG: hypothetical protein K2N09_00230 [Muribaculaceae bacterium]|nr:hypothetical protein [Muribaculaceae bacterium]